MDAFILHAFTGIFVGLSAGVIWKQTDVGRANNALAGFLGGAAGGPGIAGWVISWNAAIDLALIHVLAAALGGLILQGFLGRFANLGPEEKLS